MKKIVYNRTKKRKNALVKAFGATVLISLMLINVASAAPFAYVANSENSNVTVIDTAINPISPTMPVEIGSFEIALSPDGSKLYAANNASNNVSVIDTTTGSITTSIAVGAEPAGVAVNPNGTKVYVTNYRANTTSVIDTSTNNVTATVPVGEYPFGVAVSPDGSKVYVANTAYLGNATYNSNVSVIDAATNTVIANISTGNGSLGVAVVPDEIKVYVTNSKDNTTSVINATDNTILTTIDLEWEPSRIITAPDGKTVYVVSDDSKNVSVINTTTNSVTSTLAVGTLQSAIVEIAKNWIGIKSVHGGNNTSAIDCSHLVYQVYKQAGVKGIVFEKVPAMKNNTYYVNTSSPVPGDVIFWEKDVPQNNRTYWLTTHVGIYTGNEQLIDTSYDTEKVEIENISGVYKEGMPYFSRWSYPLYSSG
jgi:YVTN family beta-propeller protein